MARSLVYYGNSLLNAVWYSVSTNLYAAVWRVSQRTFAPTQAHNSVQYSALVQ